MGSGSLDAQSFASDITAEAAEKRDEVHDAELRKVGLDGLGTSFRPTAPIEALRQARDFHAVMPLSLGAANILMLETCRKSSASVAAGLRCWHAFALFVLNYTIMTLPLGFFRDIVVFVTIFKNAVDAANHTSYINWA